MIAIEEVGEGEDGFNTRQGHSLLAEQSELSSSAGRWSPGTT